MSAGKMHIDEVDVDVSLVDRLLAAQFPQWADLPIEPVLSDGTVNAIYRLGDDMAVKPSPIPGVLRKLTRSTDSCGDKRLHFQDNTPDNTLVSIPEYRRMDMLVPDEVSGVDRSIRLNLEQTCESDRMCKIWIT